MVELNPATQQKEEFLKRILKMDEHEKKEDHYNVMTKETYDKLINEIEEAQRAAKKTQKQYRRLNRFRVLNICGTRRLATKKEPMRYYLHVDEIYDIIKAVHEAVGHGGRDKIKNETSKNYANITIEIINIFLSMCELCHRRKNITTRGFGLPSKPLLNSDINSRCHVNLIDMQTQEDGGFKFIMVFQFHLTKFVMLRALRSKSSVAVAHEIAHIFLIFGAPCILQSDNGKEFANSVIDEVAAIWPECKMVCGEPRQGQGSVEQDNKDIVKMLAVWMQDNNSTSWSKGLSFVQFMKNRTIHPAIKQSPYKAMFGFEPRMGLTTSSLPADVIKALRDEDDLERALSKITVINKENEAPNDAETLHDSELSAVAGNSRQSQITATVKQEDADEAIASSNSISSELQVIPDNDDGPEFVANTIQQTKIIAAAEEKAHVKFGKQTKRMKLSPDLIRDPLEIDEDMISVADIKVEFSSM